MTTKQPDLSEQLTPITGYTWYVVYLGNNDGPLRDVAFEFLHGDNPHLVQITGTSHQSIGGDAWGDVLYNLDSRKFNCITTNENCAKHFRISVVSNSPLPDGFRVSLSGVGETDCIVTVKKQGDGILIDETITDSKQWPL